MFSWFGSVWAGDWVGLRLLVFFGFAPFRFEKYMLLAELSGFRTNLKVVAWRIRQHKKYAPLPKKKTFQAKSNGDINT